MRNEKGERKENIIRRKREKEKRNKKGDRAKTKEIGEN